MTRLLVMCLLLLCLATGGSVSSQAGVLLDASGERVISANVTGIPTGYPLTFAAVARFTTAGPTLFHCGVYGGTPAGWSMFFSSGQMSVNMISGSPITITSTNAYTTGNWLFVGWSSLNATTHRLYVYDLSTRTEVVNQTFATNMGAVTAPTTRCTLGQIEDTTNTFVDTCDCEISWAAMYAADLTIQGGDALRAMAHLGPYAVANPGWLYTLNEMTGTTAQERRGTANTGTLVGTIAWMPISLPGPTQGRW